MTLALVALTLAVSGAGASFGFLVRASADDHTPTRTYVACIIGGFASCTALSVAILALLRVVVGGSA